ncbi:MAG: sigma-54-dependent Fis family transcriptional regulator [Granulosicoccus sp.]
MRTSKDSRADAQPQPMSTFPDLNTVSASQAYVEASWNRCEAEYGLSRGSSLLGNRYSQSELVTRRERIEEPLRRVDPVIHEIRKVVRNADYCMLIGDSEGAAIAEYCDTAMARDLKKRGITVGTIWDESCVGTNGLGTALASQTAITVNGDQHYHNSFHQFICSAAPLLDHRGVQYGAINVTGNATQSQTEVVRVGQYVRRSAELLHTYCFRDFFRQSTLVAITDSLFNENHDMSRLLAIDDTGRIVGATNDLLTSLGIESRQSLVGTPIGELIGLNLDVVFSSNGRLHRLEKNISSGRYAVSVPPRERAVKHAAQRGRRTTPIINSGNHLSLDELAGSDRRTQKLVNVCRRMLSHNVSAEAIPILLQGETGTGKDSFARALHNESRRAQKQFVELNCAAIPESLIDSELFGYSPGTFTGGLKDGKTGYIVAANGGTLFLDEIGDMPMESQTRLLRVLAEHKVQPLGSAKSVEVDFQLVCASHRDLPSLVESGHFREDLYYRVCGATLTLPALRNRQDFADIVETLLLRFDPDRLVSLSDPVWDQLKLCQWPGNIRQLHNVLQYTVFSCGDGLATLDDLPDDLTIAPTNGNVAVTTPTAMHPADRLQVQPTVSSQPMYLSPKEELTQALYRNRWCVSKTAKDLGISRATAHRHMKKYGIVRPDHQIA